MLPHAFPGIADGLVPEVIERAVGEHGFDVVELTPAESDADRRAVAACLVRAQVRPLFLAGLPLLRAAANLSGQGEVRQRAAGVVRSTIEQARDVGARAVLVTSGPRPAAGHRAEALTRLVDSLTELAEFAAEVAPDVALRLEPTDTDLQHRQLVGPTGLAVSVVDRVRQRGVPLDLNLDLSHLLELEEKPEEALALAAGHCRHVHLANCVLQAGHPLRGDRHPPFGHPGSLVGEAELADALAALRELGYLTADAVVGVEVTPLEGADPWATLATAVSTVRAAEMAALTRSSAAGTSSSPPCSPAASWHSARPPDPNTRSSD